MKVEGAEAAGTRTFPAEIRAGQKVDLAFPMPGTLASLKVKEGQRVKKGQVIGVLDARMSERRRVAAKAGYDQAKLEQERGVKLHDQGVIARAPLDQLNAQLAIRKAEYGIAQQAVTDSVLRAPFSGRVTMRHVDSFAEVQAKQPIVTIQDLNSLEIIVGVPERLRSAVRPGQDVAASARLEVLPEVELPLSLRETSSQSDPRTQTYQLVFGFEAPEGTEVLPGMTATVSLDVEGAQRDAGSETPGAGETDAAAGSTGSAQARGATDAAGGSETERGAQAAGETESGALAAGSTGSGAAGETESGATHAKAAGSGDVLPAGGDAVESGAKVHLLPVHAVGTEPDGGRFVWTVSDDFQVVRRPVKLGTVRADTVEVLSGLEDGMTIVTAGVSYLSEGQTVRLM